MNKTTEQKAKLEQKAKSTADEGRLTMVEKLIQKHKQFDRNENNFGINSAVNQNDELIQCKK